MLLGAWIKRLWKQRLSLHAPIESIVVVVDHDAIPAFSMYCCVFPGWIKEIFCLPFVSGCVCITFLLLEVS